MYEIQPPAQARFFSSGHGLSCSHPLGDRMDWPRSSFREVAELVTVASGPRLIISRRHGVVRHQRANLSPCIVIHSLAQLCSVWMQLQLQRGARTRRRRVLDEGLVRFGTSGARICMTVERRSQSLDMIINSSACVVSNPAPGRMLQLSSITLCTNTV